VAIPRTVLIALIIAHLLVVWTGLGLLGEGWIMQPFCAASRVAGLSLIFLLMWLAATLAPAIGLASLKFPRLQSWYLGLVALTFATIWFGDFMREIDLFHCDGP